MTEQNILNFPAQISLEFGLDYLSRVKLTNLALAEQQLAAFLDRLLEQPPESGVLLELLETLRAPLCFINEEMARRYHNKMVPLTSEEDAAFHSVTSSWSKMCRAYALCASLVRPRGSCCRNAPAPPAFQAASSTSPRASPRS